MKSLAIKHKLDSLYAIMPFKYHDEIKNALLEKISTADYRTLNVETAEVNITRADWHNSNNMQRVWVQHIARYLLEELAVLYKEIGFDSFKINEIWFQQYLSGSGHGWHSHSSNFTNVYYLELPNGSPLTQIASPYDRKQIIEIDVKEGDLLVFPSYALHRAPVNKSSQRKTIISYNIDAMVSDDTYGFGVGNNE